MSMWNKTTKIVATISAAFGIVAGLYITYNHFAKQSSHVALAADVKENYATQSELIAANKNVQQTNYDFWIYRLKQNLKELYAELRKTADSVDKQQIKDQIEEIKKEIQRYKDKLDKLK